MGLKNEEKAYYVSDYSNKIYNITDEEGNILPQPPIETCYFSNPYLSEYILKYTEMRFRERFGYKPVKFPEKLKYAIKRKAAKGYCYVLSADPELLHNDKIYISLYDDIEGVILDTTRIF